MSTRWMDWLSENYMMLIDLAWILWVSISILRLDSRTKGA